MKINDLFSYFSLAPGWFFKLFMFVYEFYWRFLNNTVDIIHSNNDRYFGSE